ncbi:MAG TPA: ABC transporter ATP-binding protein [Gaiellaceae bacterium]
MIGEAQHPTDAPPLKPTRLAVDNVTIEYTSEHGTVVACKGVNFEVRDGEFVALIGRSGCGKTSILYAIDGLLPITDGEIRLNDVPVKKPGRDRAVVFQTASLFPWRSVLANITYGAEAHGDRNVGGRARELVELVGLSGFEKHRPHQLSGGMQQRVNLARALAVEPSVLLLDEPFSALDAQTRESLQDELQRISAVRNAGNRSLTMIFVTHDISEAVYLADRVIVFSSRPGFVRADVAIDLPRPRDASVKQSAPFQAFVTRLRELIDEDA